MNKIRLGQVAEYFDFLSDMTSYDFKNKEWSNINGRQAFTFVKNNSSGCITEIDANTMLVAFEGSNDIGDFFMDAFFFKSLYFQGGKVRGRVHSGFMIAWEQMKDEAFEALRILDPSKEKVYRCAGHSLGAALAVLMADDLITAGYKVDACFTAGCPRVGNHSVVKWFSSRFLTYRFVNNYDSVPALLSCLTSYYHTGPAYYFFKGKLQRSWLFRYRFWNYLKVRFSDHHIPKYARNAVEIYSKLK